MHLWVPLRLQGCCVPTPYDVGDLQQRTRTQLCQALVVGAPRAVHQHLRKQNRTKLALEIIPYKHRMRLSACESTTR